MDPHDMGRPDPALLGLHTGYVSNIDDPEKAGRVRVVIPGLIDEPGSAWAHPLGTGGGGAKDRGDATIPAVGSEVGIWFKQGDPDHPYYITGAWGRDEMPEPARSAGAEVSKIRVIETEGFRIVLDSRPSSRSLLLEDKASGDKVELDGVTRAINIKSTTKLTIEATGIVEIKGATVLINGVPAGSGQL